MNTLIKDGGPAFPHAQRLWDNDAQSWAVHSVGGMTLRDWFAGQALEGMMGNSALVDTFSCHPGMAKEAFWLADAMLAAREKGQP
jgi:hypothetical protein